MISIVPLQYYTLVYYYTILFLVFFAVLKLLTNDYVIHSPKKKEYGSLLLLLATILYMGLRPISGIYFGDMGNYGRIFESYVDGVSPDFSRGDILWTFFMKFCSGIMTVDFFFLLCAALYITPLFIASKKWLGVNSYCLFLMFLASFSFWAYGTNGIRNGIATSIFVLALSLYKKKYFRYLLLIIAYFTHESLIIPITAFILTLFFKNPKHYLLGWLVAIPLSLLLGGSLESFFGSLGFGGDRSSAYLLDDQYADDFSSTGFRWDFVIYSASAIFAGYYFIIKQNFKDPIYIQLFNIYILGQ
jgi:hypothetical protein